MAEEKQNVTDELMDVLYRRLPDMGVPGSMHTALALIACSNLLGVALATYRLSGQEDFEEAVTLSTHAMKTTIGRLLDEAERQTEALTDDLKPYIDLEEWRAKRREKTNG